MALIEKIKANKDGVVKITTMCSHCQTRQTKMLNFEQVEDLVIEILKELKRIDRGTQLRVLLKLSQ